MISDIMSEKLFFLMKIGANLTNCWTTKHCLSNHPRDWLLFFGCAYSGVVNTLHRIVNLTEKTQFHAVLGGMHLLRVSKERIERTEAVFRDCDLQRIGPAHCTGADATRRF